MPLWKITLASLYYAFDIFTLKIYLLSYFKVMLRIWITQCCVMLSWCFLFLECRVVTFKKNNEHGRSELIKLTRLTRVSH